MADIRFRTYRKESKFYKVAPVEKARFFSDE